MYGDGRTERLVLNCRAWLVRGFSSPQAITASFPASGSCRCRSCCVPCRRPGGTVRDCGCRDLVPPATFLKAGPRRDGRRASRASPIGHVRRLGGHRAWGSGATGTTETRGVQPSSTPSATWPPLSRSRRVRRQLRDEAGDRSDRGARSGCGARSAAATRPVRPARLATTTSSASSGRSSAREPGGVFASQPRHGRRRPQYRPAPATAGPRSCPGPVAPVVSTVTKTPDPDD